MKKLLLCFLFASSLAYGQRNFSIEETVFGPRTFSSSSIYGAQWVPATEALTHLSANQKELSIRALHTKWNPQTLVSAQQLQEAIQQHIIQDSSFNLSSFPANYSWKDSQRLHFTVQHQQMRYVLQYDLHNHSIHKKIAVPSSARNMELRPDYSAAAYLVGNNIHLIDAAGNITAITDDQDLSIVNGSENTHRQEFGIHKGMWWSPDGSKLLYYRKDESMVTKYPLIQWQERIARNQDIVYPMAGMKSEEVTLVIYDLASQSKTTLQTGEPREQYLTIPSWDPSSQHIYVGLLNRGQDHLKLVKFEARSGARQQTLFEEQLPTWVEPQHDLIFIPNKPNQFLYQTDIDGFNQLYLYNTQGALIRKLGFQDVIVDKFLGFNAKNTAAQYIGITRNGLDRQLFEVDLRTGKTEQITQQQGTHQATLSSSGKYIYDQFSSLSVSNTIHIRDRKHQQSTVLVEATNPFEGKINLPIIDSITLTSADGNTPLNARIIYPPNFESTKKYPVMVYLYGGSHAQMVQNKWLYGAGYFDLYMAQQGYIVFTLDNRGSDARGRDFTRVTHRHLGQAEMQDQLVGVDFLTSKSFVNADRIGIFGWSFGGYMTTSLMTHFPEVFHTGVAGGPVIDWRYYEVMYGERYMDTPQQNPTGYQETSLLAKAKNLQGNLLMIHGAQDPVVVQQHSMEFVEACIKAGVPIDYFLYPRHEHNVSGVDRVHMYAKIAAYFDMHLKK